MYSTLTVRKNSKISGRLIGTHQKLDQISRKILSKNLPKKVYFPSEREILHFEGMRGPDGLKRKSPGKDEPLHFIVPDHNDGRLERLIKDHLYNLTVALKTDNRERAAFEAAWLAHAVTDGLTPAHHFPLEQIQNDLMTEKEFIKIFGVPIKGIMRGKNLQETLKNNWRYWGINGHMSRHIAFEYGVAVTLTALPPRAVDPHLTKKDFINIDPIQEFYKSLNKIAHADLYTDFRKNAWTPEIVAKLKRLLFPEIIRVIVLFWASAAQAAQTTQTTQPSRSSQPSRPAQATQSSRPAKKTPAIEKSTKGTHVTKL